MNQVVILAGGKGTRMQSERPKVLMPVHGVPMIRRILRSISGICDQPALVVGYRAEEIMAELGDECLYVRQPEQLGTGHAIQCAQAQLELKGYDRIIVMPGDHPLVSQQTFEHLIALHEREEAKIAMAIVEAPNFEGDFVGFSQFGRILRDGTGDVAGIVEVKDATEEQKQIREVNTGYYCFDARWLWENIGRLDDHNAAGEYYLTDMIGIARAQGERVVAMTIENPYEGFGVNDREQLAIAEKYCDEK